MSNHVSVGQYLLQRLYEKNVHHIFGIPGDYVLGFYDLLEQSRIQHVGTCREDGAGFAADAYARINGLGAVCEALGVVARKKPVGVALEDLEDLGRFRAALFAAFFAGKPVTISQKRLSELFGRTPRTLYNYARRAGVDVIYNAEIADYNVRSWKAFQRVGYQVVQEVEQAPGKKAAVGYDLALTKDGFLSRLDF